MTIIGVDAGGSHTEAVVALQDRNVIGREKGPPAALGTTDIESAAQAIVGTARRALACVKDVTQADHIIVGAAGAGDELRRIALRDAIGASAIASRVDVTTDGEIALASAFGDGAGVVLMAGTGSVAFGRTTNNRLVRTGGYGYRFDDVGSGYSIGRQAIAHAFRVLDGRATAQSILCDNIVDHLKLSSLSALPSWTEAASPSQVADLATLVLETADTKGCAADTIVADAVDQLCKLAVTTFRKCEADGPLALAMGGGLLGAASTLRPRVTRNLQALAPDIRIDDVVIDPAVGALRTIVSTANSLSRT